MTQTRWIYCPMCGQVPADGYGCEHFTDACATTTDPRIIGPFTRIARSCKSGDAPVIYAERPYTSLPMILGDGPKWEPLDDDPLIVLPTHVWPSLAPGPTWDSPSAHEWYDAERDAARSHLFRAHVWYAAWAIGWALAIQRFGAPPELLTLLVLSMSFPGVMEIVWWRNHAMTAAKVARKHRK